jgi:DNA repair protein RadC
MPLLAGLKREQFQVVLLDQKNKIIRDVMVSQGSLTASVVHPREVFHMAIRDSAAAIICVHNHPSGAPRSA